MIVALIPMFVKGKEAEAEKTLRSLTVKEGKLLANAWLIAREAQCLDVIVPKYFVAGQINDLFHHNSGFQAIVERIQHFDEAAWRAAKEKCLGIVRRQTSELANLGEVELLKRIEAEICKEWGT